MDRTRLTPLQESLVRDLFDAFCDRDYPECTAKVFELGMTLGMRYFTPILTMGINFEIHREPNVQICLIYTISHLRLGDQEGAEAPFMMGASQGGEFRAWLNTLIALSLRRTTLEAALEEAASETQRAQSYYYEGEGLITDRKFADALEMFKRCLDLRADCPERTFAARRVAWLEEGGLPS